MDKKLHIVSFSIPLPANYGGAIDVFYRIKALHAAGVKIILHCFQYGDQIKQDALLAYCQEVHYYKRLTGIQGVSLLRPYIVNSRKNSLLLKNLTKDDAPILFEGLHTCYYLNHPSLKGRKKYVRAHNIEHDYYAGLARYEKNWWKRLYFQYEAKMLKNYEEIYKEASCIFVISSLDEQYFNKITKAILLLPFHEHKNVQSRLGKGTYCLFHGNMSVAENSEAALYLINQVAKNLSHEFIIAGLAIPSSVKECAQQFENVKVLDSPSDGQMSELLQNAQVHVLFSKLQAGVKLKLLSSLYCGRFVLANPEILNIEGIHHLVEKATNAEAYVQQIKELFKKEFTQDQLDQREKILAQNFSNEANVQKIIEEVFST